MNPPPCTLTMLAARPDLPFIAQTIPHLVRSLNFPFQEKLLFLDTAPLPARYNNQPGVGSLDDLLRAGKALCDRGVIDRCVEVRHDDAQQLAIYHRHYAPAPAHTRDYRGYPNLACALELEMPSTDYVLHFDSDILLHCAPGFDWVSRAAALLVSHPEALFVAPRPGPPTGDGRLRQANVGLDPGGFFRFKHFSSRRYLVDRRRFRTFLPLRPRAASRRIWLRGLLRGQSDLEAWEVLVSRKLGESAFIRADTADPQVWTLHTPDHGPEFIAALPQLILRIEEGKFPPAQAGDYDLRLDLWR
jgi:hypothetical protein